MQERAEAATKEGEMELMAITSGGGWWNKDWQRGKTTLKGAFRLVLGAVDVCFWLSF